MYVMTKTVTATELRTKTAEIIDKAFYKGITTLVLKHGKVVAKVVPAGVKTDAEIQKDLDDTFGSIPDFPKITRTFSKRSEVSLD